MTAPSAFRASYADWKLIKTRGVVSISFEVPLNESHLAYEALGGMPVAAKEIWCGIAQLAPEKEVMRNDDGRTEGVLAETSRTIAPDADRPKIVTLPRQEPSTPDGAKAKTAFRDMRMANQAGILCDKEPFRRFLRERLKWSDPATFDAAEYVRRYCNVATRADIRPRTRSGDNWQKLFDEYQVWMHASEYAA